jgi:hypothetical protein
MQTKPEHSENDARLASVRVGRSPKLSRRSEFFEWTGVDHFRHTKFVPLRDDKASDGRQGNIVGRSSNRSVDSPEAQIADVF